MQIKHARCDIKTQNSLVFIRLFYDAKICLWYYKWLANLWPALIRNILSKPGRGENYESINKVKWFSDIIHSDAGKKTKLTLNIFDIKSCVINCIKKENKRP